MVPKSPPFSNLQLKLKTALYTLAIFLQKSMFFSILGPLICNPELLIGKDSPVWIPSKLTIQYKAIFLLWRDSTICTVALHYSQVSKRWQTHYICTEIPHSAVQLITFVWGIRIHDTVNRDTSEAKNRPQREYTSGSYVSYLYIGLILNATALVASYCDSVIVW